MSDQGQGGDNGSGFSTLKGGHGGGQPQQPQQKPGQPQQPSQPPHQRHDPAQPPPPQGWPQPQQPQPQYPPPPQQPQHPPAQQQHYAPQQQQYAPQQQQYAPQQQPYAPPAQQQWQGAPPPPPPGHIPAAYLPGTGAHPPAPQGTGFGAFLQISMTRAFRLRIEANEVLPDEREALERATPPIVTEDVQSFMAWRRSLLFMIAVLLIPVCIFGAIDAFKVEEGTPDVIKTMGILEWLTQAFFLVACWVLLKSWTNWNQQRRRLLICWAIYFLASFLMFLYPFREAVEDLPPQQAILVGLMFSVAAMLKLAPKVICLMPGLIRGAIAAKLLFPGASAPGWLMVIVAPIYALLAFVILMMPYQISGSGFFILAIGGFCGAQFWLARMGYRMARPLPEMQSNALIKKARIGYLVSNALGGLFLMIALASLIEQLNIPWRTVVLWLFTFFANVFALTLIATDMTLVGLERARLHADDERSEAIHEAYEERLSHFIASHHGPQAKQ